MIKKSTAVTLAGFSLIATGLIAVLAPPPVTEEVIVSMDIAGVHHTIAVYGTMDCLEATDYAVAVMQNPGYNLNQQSWKPEQLVPTGCTIADSRGADIFMTHLDGWHYRTLPSN